MPRDSSGTQNAATQQLQTRPQDHKAAYSKVSSTVKRLIQQAAAEDIGQGRADAGYRALHSRAAAQMRSYIAMIAFKVGASPLPRKEVDVERLLTLIHTVESDCERRKQEIELMTSG